MYNAINPSLIGATKKGPNKEQKGANKEQNLGKKDQNGPFWGIVLPLVISSLD